MNSVLSTTKYVIDNSSQTRINQDAILKFCEGFDVKNNRHWLEDAPFDISDLEIENRLKFILLFNSLSFSYWAEPVWSTETQCWYEPTWKINFQQRKHNGSWGLISDLVKSLLNGRLKLDCREWSSMSLENLASILNEDGLVIPLLKNRLKNVREIGNVLLKKFDGKVLNLVKAASGDAVKLLDLVIGNFPSFADSSFYKGKEIFFWKRAQVFVSDVCDNFNLKNSDQLTACADYKIPMILRRFGILKYSKELSEKIDQKVLLSKDSEEEIEIRAATIWAVELMRKELMRNIPNIKSIEINNHLWLLGQTKNPDDKPYHRTRTTAY